MMPVIPVIKRVACLEKLYVFRKYVAPADLPILRKHNLIYGFNGSGKTTLAKLFSSLGEGVLDASLPSSCVFHVELSDDTTIRNGDALDDRLKERVFVFNDDFIERNFKWKEGKINPVFFIGKEQMDVADQLQEEETARQAAKADHEQAEKQWGQADRAFTQHKRDSARLIAEELNLGRRYTAQQLTNDYNLAEYGKECVVADEERKKLRATIAQDTPNPKIQEVPADALETASIAADGRTLLAQTLGSIAVEELQQHDAMLNWLKAGLEYHREKELAKCLFCGSELRQDRLNALATVLDNRFTRLVDGITEATTLAEKVRDGLSRLRTALPAKGDVAMEHRASYSVVLTQLSDSIAAAKQMIVTVIEALATKQRSPNTQFIIDGYPADDEAKRMDKELAARLAALNAVIAKHNATHDDFSTAQEDARKRLREHYLAAGQADYRRLESEQQNAGRLRASLISRIAESNAKIEDLKRQVRTHGFLTQTSESCEVSGWRIRYHSNDGVGTARSSGIPR